MRMLWYGGKKITMLDKIRIYILAAKYWMQGDDWKEAVEYAESLVLGWKNR